MDAIGAQELRKRLDEQKHWRQAEAVRDKRQPATDPDSAELEETSNGTRYYGHEKQRTLVDGRPALVTSRLIKTIVDGWWQTSYERESVQYLD